MAGEPTTSFAPTPEQKRGIETTGVNLLVSAAAGSGKTKVLAERCAYLVCDAPQRCGVDELLVVTFTEAAAGEMKDRIARALRQRLDRDPDDARLVAQVAQIDRAQVSTLHGFCSRLLKRHFHLLGLDPNFGVLDADEASLLRIEIARDLFADRYEADEAGVFQKLIDLYGDGRDETLQDRVLHTHELLNSVIDPDDWLAVARTRLTEAAEKPLAECPLGRELISVIRRRLDHLVQRANEAVALIASLDGMAKVAAYMRSVADAAELWQARFGPGHFDLLAEAVQSYDPGKKPPVARDHPHKGAVDAAIDSVRGEMAKDGELYALARFRAREWTDGLRSLLPFASAFLDLVADFRARYAAAKQRARSIDFADLERFALTLLRQRDPDGRWLPSPVARECHYRIAHVLVDEYQDINAVQDEILRLVSRECLIHRQSGSANSGSPRPCTQGRGVRGEGSPAFGDPPCGHAAMRPSAPPYPNLFCVGDVKQSIYGFRLAEPERFLQRDVRYRDANGDGEVIDLQQNFRSRGPLLEAINALFAKLMTKEAAGLDYDESQRLRPAAPFPPAGPDPSFTGAPIELHLLPRKLDGVDSPDGEEAAIDADRTEREAIFIARRIRQLMGLDGHPRTHVAEKNADGPPTLRPIQYRDMVILLRSTVYKAEQFAETLRQHNVPVYRDSGSGYFNTTEVRDLLSLLQLLDNAQQDIPFAAVLRSPLAGLPDPEDNLARIRLAYREDLAAFSPSPGTPGEGRGGGSSATSNPKEAPSLPRSTGRGDDPTPFHQAVARYAAERNDDLAQRLRTFLSRLDRWRTLSRLRPLADLLWTILDETGYVDFCAALDNGDQRRANLLYLHERARQFGSFSRQGLYRFLRFLDDLQTKSDLGQPSVLGEGEDVVRIMSVHKSKGLEFPVVFLPDLGKRLNLNDASARVLVDREAYLGMPAVDEAKQVRYPSVASVLVGQRLRQRAMAEELRVLYVATTRAKEHLILCGTCDTAVVDKWATRWSAHRGPFPADMVLNAGCLLDWIGPSAVALRGSESPPFELTIHAAEEVASWSVAASKRVALTPWQEARAKLQPLHPAPPADAAADDVIRRISATYAAEPFTALRAAISVTEWARAEHHSVATPSGPNVDTLLPLPRFLAGGLALAPTDRGVATHLALQHLDLLRPCRGDDLRAQLDEMQAFRKLTPTQATAVDRDAIDWFFTTDLAHFLRSTPTEDVLREVPFTLALPPERFPHTPPSSDPQDHVMLRGRIDVLLRQRPGATVIDYKTDRLAPADVDARTATYAPQVSAYRQAIEAITGHPLAAVHVVFLSARQIRQL